MKKVNGDAFNNFSDNISEIYLSDLDIFYAWGYLASYSMVELIT